ncbi:MAG TPA: hypothetical protein VMV10_03245 [Pirellulales bacterium]|nr:hypothetical protein [Pirellulales bacterium]
MPRFRILPLLMALGVTFNHFHCIGTSVQAAAFVMQEVRRAQVDGPSQDLGSVPKCENETGCICQGAIFIAPPPYDLVDLTACQWTDEAQPAIVETLLPLQKCVSNAALERRHFAPSLTKGAMRAWLGRFLI